MLTSPFRPICDQIDRLFAQGARLTSSDALEALMRACAAVRLSQPLALLQQIQQQIEQGQVNQKTAETLIKVLQTLKQTEILTSKPEVVNLSALRKIHPDQSVYLANDQTRPAESATLNDILALVNPFARAAQVTHYLQRASLDEVRRSIAVIWFDYGLLTAIRNGLAARPEEAFEAAKQAFAFENPVMQRVALAVFASLGAHAAYRRAAIDLLRERAQKFEEPVKYWVMETVAMLENTLPAYRLAQRKFFNDHVVTMRQLVSPKKAERARASKALAKTKNPCFTQVLLTLFDDPELRVAAIEASVKIGAFPVIPRLVHMLKTPVQHHAALALYHFGDRQGLEYFLRRKLLFPLEHDVLFIDYGDLLIDPLMRILRQDYKPADIAKGCQEIFTIKRSPDFAERVLSYAERDPGLARQLAAIIKRVYPGEYAAIVPLETDNIASDLLRTLILTTLSRNPHTIVAKLKEHYVLNAILVTPDGRHVVTLNARGDVTVWNTTTWKKSAALILPPCGQYPYPYFHAIALSVDGQHVLIANHRTKEVVEVFAFQQWDAPISVLRQNGAVYGIGTTSDGRYVLGGGQETVTVWEWGTWRAVTTLFGHQHGVEAITAVPGQPIVITGSRDGTLHVWAQGTWRRITSLKVNSIMATSVVCSPDGRYLAVVDTLATYLETKVRVWETATWSEVAYFAIPSQTPITCFAFTPDSRYLLTGADEVKFLEVGSWQEKLTLSNASTRALAALPDGEHIIAGHNVWKIDRTKLT